MPLLRLVFDSHATLFPPQQDLRFEEIMDTFVKVLLLFCVSLSRGQDACYKQDWSTTFGAATEDTSQCRDDVSYVSGFQSQEYGEQGQVGLTVIKSAFCCNVKIPYSQEGNQCVWREWWLDLTGYVHSFVVISVPKSIQTFFCYNNYNNNNNNNNNNNRASWRQVEWSCSLICVKESYS